MVYANSKTYAEINKLREYVMKKLNLYKSVLSTVLISGIAFAEPEVSGKITLESASFTNNGTSIGATSAHGKDNFKNQISGRVYVDGGLEDDAGSTYHVELQGFNDSKAVGSHDGNESYTQRDPLREAYIDTTHDDWALRIGKQQVVWGTADGMKLLDAINPTDYSEMAQNQMEDSRIPVWMLNAETNDENGGNWQFIVSEGKSNYFSGLGEESAAKGSGAVTSTTPFTAHTNNSSGHPFISKGVDTITGKKNGFLNVAPALGSAAQAFDRLAYSGATYVSLQGYYAATVNEFNTGGGVAAQGFAGVCTGPKTTAQCLATAINGDNFEVSGAYGASNNERQNVIPTTLTNAQWVIDKANPTYTVAYMPETTFATFDTFVNMKSKYVVDHDDRATVAARYKNTTEGGLNYTFNIMHGNDANPYIDMEWQNTSGAKLYETTYTNSGYVSNILRTSDVGTSSATSSNAVGGLKSYDSGSGDAVGSSTNVAVLTMTEKLNPITQIGGSMDMAIETDELGPVIIRAEALYQKDVMSPVITRKASGGKDLNHGFLVNALKMQKGDRFKYVIGADITALTNMMVSLQFIQDRNLDYVNIGNKDATNWKYTGDMATMHLSNNLNKAEKNKEFYSLYLSKPFGESGQHRWNNIFMYEENGGKWNRLDVEYTIDDNTVATAEYNKYFGDKNTQFGQFKDSSNIQVGLKYSF